MLKSVRNC